MSKCICVQINSYFEVNKVYNYNIVYSERYEKYIWEKLAISMLSAQQN